MATEDSIACFLGYTNVGQYTRGHAEILYQKIEELVREYSWYNPVEVTRNFLEDWSGGVQCFPRTGLSIINDWPEWDRDRER